MVRSLLKTAVFTSGVLLLGQVPLAGSTIGGKFKDLVFDAAHKAGQQISKHTTRLGMEAGVGGSFSWLKKSAPPAPKPTEVAEKESDVDEPEEDLAPSDQESILRLLQ